MMMMNLPCAEKLELVSASNSTVLCLVGQFWQDKVAEKPILLPVLCQGFRARSVVTSVRCDSQASAAAPAKAYSLRPDHQLVLMRIDFSHQPPGPLMGEVRFLW